MKYKLADVVDIIGGGTPKTTKEEYWNGTIPWLSVKDFNNDQRYVYTTEKSITELGLENSSTKLLQKDDIIISARGTVGELAMIPFSMAFNQSCYGLRARKQIIEPVYLYYLLKYHIKTLKTNTHGSVFDTITRDTFSSVEVDIAALDDQNDIALILSSLDDKIELNIKINANLQQQAQAIFKSWFVDFEPFDGVQPGCWEEVPFGQLVEIGKKSFNPAKEPEILLEHYSIPAYDETKCPVFELSTNIKSNKFLVDKDCFLISKLNPTTKRVWRPYCLSNHAVCSTEFIVYRAKNRAYADFLYSVVDSEPFSAFMCSHVTGTTGSRQRTTPSETLNFPLVLPTPEAIERFTEIVNPMYAKMKECMVENQKLKQLRDGLLPKLMSGELIV